MALPPLNDTIAAIATAPGQAAVGIVRVSGPESYPIVARLFRPASGKRVTDLAANQVVFGRLYDGDALVDECLLLTFRAPRSYTTQDVLEIQTHGGTAVVQRVLDVCLQQGARLAKPGEFTMRAYLSGRIDLLQAEAVLAMVNAQSETARRNASLGLSKALSDALHIMQTTLTEVYGNLQAVFDYPEEGVPEAEFRMPVKRVMARIDELLATANAGRLLRQGAKLALIGRPNAGKSSLLNVLLGYDRSLVSDTPGTTRDYLEAPLELHGMPITAIDTAGIRDTADVIEASGVQMAKDIAAAADVTLLLVDGSQPLQAEDKVMLGQLEPSRSLVIATKADLPAAWQLSELTAKDQPHINQNRTASRSASGRTLLEIGASDVRASDAAGDVVTISVSTVTGKGMDSLKDAVYARLVGDAGTSELWLSSQRQAEVLANVRTLLDNALHTSDDLAALDIEEALRELAGLTGRGEIAEAALEHIFANFCVGK
jgi:tRNA modification GTPase